MRRRGLFIPCLAITGVFEVPLNITLLADLTVLPALAEIALGIPTGGKKADANKPESYPHIPLNRPGTAEEAAQAVLFLCSPLAAYVSGHTLE